MTNQNPNLEVNEYELAKQLKQLLQGKFDINTFEDLNPATESDGLVIKIGEREFKLNIVMVK